MPLCSVSGRRERRTGLGEREFGFTTRTAAFGVQGWAGSAAAERVLGGSWVVISGVISPLIKVISIVTLLISPLVWNRR